MAFIPCCTMISWIAVPSLAFFTWVASTEPLLLEIKEKPKEATNTLLLATVIYLVLAIFLTIYAKLKAKKQEAMEIHNSVVHHEQTERPGVGAKDKKNRSLSYHSISQEKSDDSGLIS